jgi:LacI family xylobiose transport system transcriptional regulator
MTDDDVPTRTTLARIAAEARVSLSTVSRVLNGRPGIAAATREQVESLLREHGYARRGVDAASPLVEVVCSELDSWVMELIQGIEPLARARGLATVLTETGNMHAIGPGWIDRTVTRRPRAVIVVFAGLSDLERTRLRAAGISFVALDPVHPQAADVPSVGAANWLGAVLATQHLIGLGHTRIAAMTGPPDMLSSRSRLSGYRTAMAEARLTTPDTYVVASANYHKPEAVVLGRALLGLAEPPTAIFAGNDVQAMGVYDAAADHGLRIPDDLSVIGFDDLEIAELADPPLTTVRQPLREMAALALEIALDAGPFHGAGTRIDLATTLVLRGSTAAPSSATFRI